MRAYINDHPIAALMSRATTVRTGFSAPFRSPEGCAGASDGGLRSLRDVRVTMTDYSIFAIPLRRYGVDCGGLYITRLPLLGSFRDH